MVAHGAAEGRACLGMGSKGLPSSAADADCGDIMLSCSLQLLSWNLHGVGADGHELLLSALGNAWAFLMLQETDQEGGRISYVQSHVSYHADLIYAGRASPSVWVHSRFAHCITWHNSCVWGVMVIAKLSNLSTLIASVHLPDMGAGNLAYSQALEEVSELLRTAPKRDFDVIGIDANCEVGTFNQQFSNWFGNSCTSRGCSDAGLERQLRYLTWVAEHDYIASNTYNSPNESCWTHQNFGDSSSKRHIDYVLTSLPLDRCTTRPDYDLNHSSDHIALRRKYVFPIAGATALSTLYIQAQESPFDA